MTHGAHRFAAHRLGGEPFPRLLTGGLARYRIYETADGRFLTVAALEPKFFRRFCELLELPEVDDAEAFAARIRSKTLADWLELFDQEDVAVGPVATFEEAAREFAYEPPSGGVPSLGEPPAPGGQSSTRSRSLRRRAVTESSMLEIAERLGELARDDPHLVGVALGDLRQHLQVLVGEQRLVGSPSWIAWKTVSIAFAWPCARRIARLALTLGPQDRACRSPSAVRIGDCLMPSAVRIAARLSRSARICFSIESLIDGGGSMALSSTRLTRMPHLPVASSSTPRSWLLIWSRLVSVSSRSRPPIDVAQRRHGQLLDRLDVVRDLVRRRGGSVTWK